MTWRRWIHGLAAAAIGSLGTLATTGIAGYVRDFDLTDWNFWEPVLAASLANAWLSVQLYIRKFPPPGILTEKG